MMNKKKSQPGDNRAERR